MHAFKRSHCRVMGLPSVVVPVEISFLGSPLSSRGRKPIKYVFDSFFLTQGDLYSPSDDFEQVFSILAEEFPRVVVQS